MGNLLEKYGTGLVQRDVRKEHVKLVRKWGETGLLEGLKDDRSRANMSVMLENQVKQLIKEATTMQGGNVEGFAQSAFPMVRRIFGNTIATELCSVQAMSMPNSLIFFLDYTYTNNRLSKVAGESIYGQGVVGSQITGGVLLDALNNESSFYVQTSGYTKPTASFNVTATAVLSGTVGTLGGNDDNHTGALDALVQHDADLLGTVVAVGKIDKTDLVAGGDKFSFKDYVDINLTGVPTGFKQVRRLTRDNPADDSEILVVLMNTASNTAAQTASALAGVTALTAPIKDNFIAGGALGSVVGAPTWGLENNGGIPELDMKLDSISVEAETRKLKVKWTQELDQDLNAYHSIDAEVELTNVMSRHIEMELDMEVLEDLIKGAKASLKFWSRRPGKFVNHDTGVDISNTTSPPDFTGNTFEWNQTLVERINDVSAVMHRKIVAGSANFIVCGPEVANILESTSGYYGNVTVGDDKGSLNVVKQGSVAHKFDVYVTPYIVPQLILVGRKGSGFLETGYVYAPYVPLMIFPLLHDPESFTPRKAVMTRYGKKMVRPDFYGIVIVQDLRG